MISEALGLGILPIIYNHAAMTPTSLRYIKQLSEKKKILIYPNMEKKIYKQKPARDQKRKIIKKLISIIYRF